MRFAKLEVKIIIALFLMRYEYSLVGENGKPMDKLPEPCREDMCVYSSRLSSTLTKAYTIPPFRYQTPPSAPVCECDNISTLAEQMLIVIFTQL
jgi:hypothetical protein